MEFEVVEVVEVVEEVVVVVVVVVVVWVSTMDGYGKNPLGSDRLPSQGNRQGG